MGWSSLGWGVLALGVGVAHGLELLEFGAR